MHFFTYRYGTVSQVATFIYVGSDEMIPYDNKPAYFLPTLLMFWEFQIEQRSRRVIDFSNFGYLEKQSLNGNRRRKHADGLSGVYRVVVHCLLIQA